MPHFKRIITAAREALASYEHNFHLSKEKIMEVTLDVLLDLEQEWEKTQKPPAITPDNQAVLVFVGINMLHTLHQPAAKKANEAKIEPSPLYQDLNEFMHRLFESLKTKIAGDFYAEIMHIVDLIQIPQTEKGQQGQDLKTTLTQLLADYENEEAEEKDCLITQLFDTSNLITLNEQASTVNNNAALNSEEVNVCKTFLTNYYYGICDQDKTAPSRETSAQVLSFLKKTQIKLPQGILGCFPSLGDFIAKEEAQDSPLMTCIQITSSLRAARTLTSYLNALQTNADNTASTSAATSPVLNRRSSINVGMGNAAAIANLGIRPGAKSEISQTTQQGLTTALEHSLRK